MTILVGWLLLSIGCSMVFVAGSAFGRGVWSFGGCAKSRALDERQSERRAMPSARNKLDNRPVVEQRRDRIASLVRG